MRDTLRVNWCRGQKNFDAFLGGARKILTSFEGGEKKFDEVKGWRKKFRREIAGNRGIWEGAKKFRREFGGGRKKFRRTLEKIFFQRF